MRHFIDKIKNDKKGSLLWELLVVLAILFVFLYTAVSFLGIFTQYETMTYAAKTAARQIEITGKYDQSTVESNVQELIENANLTINDIDVEPGTLDDYTNAVSAESLRNQYKLQLGQKFTFTVVATYDWHVLGSGDLFGEVIYPITMNYKVTGMSEVFWRD